MKDLAILIIALAIASYLTAQSLSDTDCRRVPDDNKSVRQLNNEVREACMNAGGVPIHSGWHSGITDCRFPK